MKNLGKIAIALFVASLVLSACKSHETCPAYSSTDAQQVETNI